MLLHLIVAASITVSTPNPARTDIRIHPAVTTTLAVSATSTMGSTISFIAASTDCGHCHSMENPFAPNQRVHQFTDDEPAWSVCSGGGGHPVHNCEDGDDSSTWAPDECHPPCPESMAAQLAIERGVSRVKAAALKHVYSDFVTYSPTMSKLILRTCSGRTVEVKVI